MSNSLAYRKRIDSDNRFIRDGFLDSYRTAHAAGLISMEDWGFVMGSQWDKILARQDVEVFVAHHPGEDDTRFDVYGFLVVSNGYEFEGKPLPFVVYCNVKHKYRRLGIATGLFKAAGIDPSEEFHYAAKTGVMSKPELRNRIPLAKWKPLAIRFKPKEKHE